MTVDKWDSTSWPVQQTAAHAPHLMNSQSCSSWCQTTHLHCEKSYQLSVTKWCFQSTWQLCLRCVWEQFIYFTWNLSGVHNICRECLKGRLTVCSSVSWWWWLLTAWGIENIINLCWFCTLQLQECGYWERTMQSRTIFQIYSAWHSLESNYTVHRNVASTGRTWAFGPLRPARPVDVNDSQWVKRFYLLKNSTEIFYRKTCALIFIKTKMAW